MKRLNTLKTIVGAGVLLAALSACGGQGSSEPAAAPPADEAPVTATQAPDAQPDRQPARTPPDGGVQVSESQVDATGLQERYPVMVWTVDNGSTLGVVAQEGGCGKASAEVAEQSAGKVVVTLVETTPAASQMCTMDLRYPKLTIELPQPLAERQVVLKSEQRKS